MILKRFNKREYKKKKTAVLKRNDKNKDIQQEIATIYSSKTYKAIKDHLEEGKHPDEVLSIIPYEARKQMKRGFRQIIDKDKRYKLMPSKVNRNSNDLLRNWNWRQEKIQKKEKKRRSRSVSSNRKNSIEDWYILSEVWQAKEIICDAHIKHGSHFKVESTYNEILRAGYRWDNMLIDIRDFYFKLQV